MPGQGSNAAEEFIQSILPQRSPKDISPLEAPLLSSGYFSRKHAPHFRHWLRPISWRFGGQWALTEFDIKGIHSHHKGKGVRVAAGDRGKFL